MDPERAERIKILLTGNIEWTYLLHLAALHGIMPLLYWHLNTICPEAVLESSFDLLRDYFYANEFHNHLLTSELLRILQLFEKQGIPAIPYKGPVLAASVYGNLSLRQFGDLDILIHKRDVQRVQELLVAQGYRPWFAHSDYHRGFDGEANRIHLEIHWNLLPKSLCFPLDFERLW